MSETKPEKSSKKERSTAYPAISLENALGYSKLLVESYRKSVFSRENAVKGIGYNKITGDTGQKVAALVYYGLLERSGNSYKNTELAQRISYHLTDEQRAKDIVQAAQTPKLFQTLIREFTMQGLPARLPNILIQSYRITPNVADKVAANFKETLEYSGILVNGIVSAISNDGDTQENTDTVLPSETTPLTRSSAHEPVRHHAVPTALYTPAGMQTLTLPSGIVLSYPTELAYSFAMGKFASKITELDEAVSKENKLKTDPYGTNSDASVE